jgi:hypothetical protein
MKKTIIVLLAVLSFACKNANQNGSVQNQANSANQTNLTVNSTTGISSGANGTTNPANSQALPKIEQVQMTRPATNVGQAVSTPIKPTVTPVPQTPQPRRIKKLNAATAKAW